MFHREAPPDPVPHEERPQARAVSAARHAREQEPGEVMRSNWQISKAAYYVDFFVVPLAVVAAGWYRDVDLFTQRDFFPLYALGWLSWTFIEYAVHRWIEHGIEPFRTEHMMHHRDPAEYIAVSPLSTVPLIIVLMFLLPLGAYLGLLAGYYTYIWVHDSFHHGHQTGPLSNRERRHLGHHRKWKTNFGVSTSLWDRVFGTFD